MAFVLLLPTAAAASAPTNGLLGPGAKIAGNPSFDRGSQLLGEARASLNAGHGPGAASLSPTSLAHPSTGQADSLAYDALDGYVVAIAPGTVTTNNSTSFASTIQTWTFLSGNWTLLNLSFAPPNRGYASMTFDPSDGYVLLFGGTGFGGSFFAPILADTWSYVGGNWTNLTTAVGAAPGPRESAPMVWDAADGYAVLFGGMGIAGNISGNLSDTWTYVAGSWTHLTGGAGPQNQGAMAYDAVDGYVLYFGGGYVLGGTSSETWSFSAGTWSSLTASVTNAPPSRANAAMATDPNVPGVLLFGGIGQPSGPGWVYYNDTWSYANLTWTLLSNASGPSPREQASMVFDAADNETILFGGVNYSDNAYADTWAFGAGGSANNSTSSSWAQAAPLLHVSLALDDVGIPVTLSAAGVQGSGSASIDYTGLPPGCATVDAIELTCVPSAAGTFSVVMTAVTPSGTARASTQLIVTDPPSVLSFQASRSVTEPGMSVTLTTTAVGGAGSLGYAYAGLPTACPSADTATIVCTPDAAGYYTVAVTVSDSLHVVAMQTLVLNVIAGPQVGFLTVTPAAIDLGQTAHIAASVVGGLSPVTFAYTNLPAGCAGSGASSLACAPSAVGVYTFGLVVTDALGASVTAQAVLTTNVPPSVTSFAGSAANITIGHSVVFTVAATGGTGALVIDYQGLPPGCAPADATTLTCSPVTTGNFTVTTTVTDAVGVSDARSVALEVDPLPQTPGPHGPGGGGSTSVVAVDTTTPFLIGAGLGLLVLAVGIALLLRRDRTAREGARLVRDLRAEPLRRAPGSRERDPTDDDAPAEPPADGSD